MSKILLKLKDEKGQNLVEFALVLIVLLLIFYGITEFGRAWYRADVLKNVANTAARSAAIQANMTSAVIKPYTSSGIRITYNFQSDSVTATASQTFNTVVPNFPVIGTLLDGKELERSATYRLEK